MVKLVVYDFDGVLTDNRVWVNQEGVESVACNRGDGWWMGEIRKLGIEQIILSTEENPVVAARAKKLNMEYVQGLKDKKIGLMEVSKRKGVSLEQICYVGNEMNDFECLRSVGYPACPSDSHPEVLKIAKIKLPAIGGSGVVRHLHDWLQESRKPVSQSKTYQPGPWRNRIQAVMTESIRVKQAVLDHPEILGMLEEMGEAGAKALANGKKIIFAGNGGSFADSMHLAAELVSKLMIDRGPLASIALGCANSNLTAIGNDYGYQFTFSREIYALGNPGDVFIAISTSGNSPNVLEAVKAAKEKGIIVYGWSGQSGGKLAQECPTIRIPSKDTARIQESHIMIGHIFCEIVEAQFLPKEGGR